MKTTTFTILLITILTLPLFADGSEGNKSNHADTTKTDTLIRKKIYPVSSFHGQRSIIAKPYKSISKKDILYTNYTDISDILYEQTNAFPLSLGSFGQNNSASFLGTGFGETQVSYNSRQSIEPDFGSFSLTQIPVEFMEKAEIFTGSDAVIFSNNATGSNINVQEINYNTAKPYTRLWYSQAGFEFLSADAVFSQNIAPNINFTAGLRSMATLGEYDNEKVENWNARFRLRYAIDSLKTISLTENYTNNKNGINGGINPKSSQLYGFYAKPYYKSIEERNTRHDLTLSYSSISNDTTSFLKTSIYLSNIGRRLSTQDFFLYDSLNRIGHTEHYFGGTIEYEKIFGKFGLSGGVESAYFMLPKTIYFDEYDDLQSSLFYRLEYGNIYSSKFSGGGRIGNMYGKTFFNIGGKYEAKFTKNSLFIIDYYNAEFVPTPMQGMDLKNENHLVGIARFEHELNHFQWGIEGFFRTIENSIIGNPVFDNNDKLTRIDCYNLTDKRQIIGGTANLKFDIKEKFYTDIKANFAYSTTADTSDRRLPIFSGRVSAYYWIKKVRSDMRLGVSVDMVSPYTGAYYFPMQRVEYYYIQDKENERFGARLNVFAYVRFRGVYVRIDLKNVLDNNYYYVPYYPQLGRNLRLSLSLPFVD